MSAEKVLQRIYEISLEMRGILTDPAERKEHLLLSKLQERQSLVQKIRDSRPEPGEEITDLIQSILSIDEANRKSMMKIREGIADKLRRIYASRRAIKGYRLSLSPEARFVDVISGT